MTLFNAAARYYLKLNASARKEIYENLLEDIKVTTLKRALDSRIELMADDLSLSKVAMQEWSDALALGQTEFDIIKAYIPKDEAIFFDAARYLSNDKASPLTSALASAKEFAQNKSTMAAQLIKPLAYPVILAMTAIVMINMAAVKIIPQLLSYKSVNELSHSAQAFVSFVELFVSNQMYLLVALVILMVGLSYYAVNVHSKLRDVLNYLPIFSVYQKNENAKVLSVLARMLGAGVAIKDSLKLIAKDSSAYTRGHIHKMLVRLNQGEQGAMFETGFFTKKMTRAIKHKFKFEDVEQALLKLSRAAQVDAIKGIARVAMLFNGLIIAAIAYFITNGFALIYSLGFTN